MSKEQKSRYDRHFVKASRYKEGQVVRIANALSTTGGNKKLLPRLKGPFRVGKVLMNDHYEVDLREGRKKSGTVASVDNHTTDQLRHTCDGHMKTCYYRMASLRLAHN